MWVKDLFYDLPYVANNQAEGVSVAHTQGEGAKSLKAP